MNIFDGYTQFGIAGLLVGIIFYIIRINITVIKSKDEKIIALTKGFMKIAQDSNESRRNLKKAIDANTEASKKALEASQQISDNMTKLVMNILKEK